MKFSLMLPVKIGAANTTRAAMLVECLESILAQTHQDYEVILKDANPGEPVKFHDNVRETMRKFGPKLNYIAMEDKGIAHGFNQALWWATGDIYHSICGDDLVGAPDTLSFVNKYFEEFAELYPSEPTWIYGSTGCVNEDGSEGPWGIQPWATLEEILVHNRMGCMATYWNRAMFQKLGYWDPTYTLAHDYDYWVKCYRTAVPAYTTRVIGVGRRWNQSISVIQSDVVEREAIEISKKHTAAHARGEAPEHLSYEQCQKL
jgi:hypothetical protein